MLSPDSYRKTRRVGLLGILILAVGFFLVHRFAFRPVIERSLETARGQAEQRDRALHLSRRGRLDKGDSSLAVRSRISELWDLTVYRGELWAASGGGVLRWPGGKSLPTVYDLRHGLAESRMRALRPLGTRLFCGMASRGLAIIEGNQVLTLEGLEGAGASIRCLHVDGKELFVGTYGSGVYRWTDEGLRFYGPPGAENRELRVTSIAGKLGCLAVGSFSRGLHVERDGAWTSSPPSGQGGAEVLSLAAYKGGWAVGTAMGLFTCDARGQSRRTLVDGVIATSLFAEKEALWMGTLASGIQRVGERGLERVRHRKGGGRIEAVRAFCRHEGSLYAATDGGLLRRKGRAWELVVMGQDELSHNHVSALAIDEVGNVWIGSFRSGIEIWSNDLSHCLQRHRDERIREINQIVWDSTNRCMWVASSAGAHAFTGFDESSFYDKSSGLLSSSVMAIRPEADRVLFATGSGLSWRIGGRMRSLSTFHGLSSNNCYTLARVNGEIWVGSLGGISRVGEEKVLGRITAVEPGLRRNWITALLTADEGTYIGTYGGGVALRGRKGTIRPLATELGDFVVNFNALVLGERNLLVGTLDDGVAIIDRQTGKGRFLDYGGASKNITAMAVRDSWLYIGSDGGVTRCPLSRFD